MARLKGRKIAVLVEDLYDNLELWCPVLRLREEGAERVDKEVVQDSNIITSRVPSDLPAFMRAIVEP